MAKRKRIKILLVSSQKGLDLLQPIVSSVLSKFENIQLELYSPTTKNIISTARQRGLATAITSSDVILVDLTHTSTTIFFEIGIARAIGKSIVFIAEEVFLDDLPDFVRQSYVLLYSSKDELEIQINFFLIDYFENPKRFIPRSLIETETSPQIDIDLDKLDIREFENLCFELLSRLGYKDLEWRIKDEFIDAVTTLRKQDPDGFEYDEFWLISFRKAFMENEWLNMAIHDPEYFIDRIYRNVIDSDMLNRSSIKYTKADIPITLLLIYREKGEYSKKIS